MRRLLHSYVLTTKLGAHLRCGSVPWLVNLLHTHTAASFTLQVSMFTGNASAGGIDDDDDDVPMLVEDFEAASKTDTGEYWL